MRRTLPGSVFCGECGPQLMVTNAKSHGGVIYLYFVCAGQHAICTNCENKALYVPDGEAAVEEYYRHIQIPEHTITALRNFITMQLSQLHATVLQERNTHVLEREDLRAEQDHISKRLLFLKAQIETGDMKYELANVHLNHSLALTRDCYKLYMSIRDSFGVSPTKPPSSTSSTSATRAPSSLSQTNHSTRSSTRVCRRQRPATTGGPLSRSLKPVMSPV